MHRVAGCELLSRPARQTTVTSIKRIIFSLDTAFKTWAENDFTVCTVWGGTNTGFYLLHLLRQRLELPDLKRKLIELAGVWKPSVVLIEDAASGQSLIQELRVGAALPVKPVKVDHDKVSRAHACCPLVECGRVYIPEPEQAPWVTDYVDETQVSLSARSMIPWIPPQALNYLRTPREPGILALYRPV